MRTSFSALNKLETCGAQYEYHYVKKIRPAFTPANLIFGGALHEAVSEYVIAHANGDSSMPDPVHAFQKGWDQAMGEKEIQFSSTQDPQSLRDTGSKLAEDFPDFWEDSGLTAMVDSGYEPMVEQKLEMEVAPSLNHLGYLDLIAITPEGETAIIDLKTTMQPAPESQVLIGEQLTDYQMLVEANRQRLGIEGVDRLGFIEMIKRKVPKTGKGKGPEIVGPTLGPARTQPVLDERRSKIIHLNGQIQRGEFFRRPGMAFNSPCSMCDFHDLCLHGSMEGLVDPNADQQSLI